MLYVRDNLEDKSYVTCSFIYAKKKIRNMDCISSKQVIFFIGVAIKLTVLVGWHTTPVFMC